MKNDFGIEGMIVNGFFLYKDRQTKDLLTGPTSIQEYIGFEGMIMTDSGAFQGLKRPLYLSNKKIVKFQDAIGADIISPLDLISPPNDNFETASKKLASTNKRIKQALQLTENSILAGVQQGGRFMELRGKSIEALMEMQVEYIAIGSLVPFFNKKHKLDFVIKVLQQARQIAGPDIPFHVYGAGDPLEMPFIAQLGTDIFDSSSYGHYALDGWYMTPFGAIRKEQKTEFEYINCQCTYCQEAEGLSIFDQAPALAGHNLHTIIAVMEQIRHHQEQDTLTELLESIIKIHEAWFPDSLLPSTWNDFDGN